MADRPSSKGATAGSFVVVEAFPWPNAQGDAPASSVLVPGTRVEIHRFEGEIHFVAAETGDELVADPSSITLVATEGGVEIQVDRLPVAIVTPAFLPPYNMPGRRLRRLLGRGLPSDNPPYPQPGHVELSDLLDDSGPEPGDIPAR